MFGLALRRDRAHLMGMCHVQAQGMCTMEGLLHVVLCRHHLGILNNFEQEMLHFYFVLGATNYVAGAQKKQVYSAVPQSPLFLFTYCFRIQLTIWLIRYFYVLIYPKLFNILRRIMRRKWAVGCVCVCVSRIYKGVFLSIFLKFYDTWITAHCLK